MIYTAWYLRPSRARILLAFVLTLVAVHWGATLAAPAARVMWRPDGTPRRAALVVSLVLLLFIVQAPIGVISWALEQRAAFAAYALGWDQMDNSLRNASLQGLREVTIATPRYGSGLEDLGPDPHHAVNRCAAWYYGLRSIVAR